MQLFCKVGYWLLMWMALMFEQFPAGSGCLIFNPLDNILCHYKMYKCMRVPGFRPKPLMGDPDSSLCLGLRFGFQTTFLKISINSSSVNSTGFPFILLALLAPAIISGK